MSIKALERHLQPLMPFLSEDGVTEVCINHPKEVYVEQQGQFIRQQVDQLDRYFLEALAGLIAEYNNKDFPSPLLSGSLPSGERVQWVMEPACEQGNLVCAIRRPQIQHKSLQDYQDRGAFDEVIQGQAKISVDQQLKDYYKNHQFLNLLRLALQAKKNILISGGTGTGKTTFLNACLQWIPLHERIITVEDTREVKVPHPNKVQLLFNEDDPRITALQLFKTCLRLRPDRILLSELRGVEVWPYLRAANSGHPGSLSTVHADTPEGAFTQLVFMMQQAGCTSTESHIRSYIKSIIHIVIQLKRCPKRFMYVSDIYFNPEEHFT